MTRLDHHDADEDDDHNGATTPTNPRVSSSSSSNTSIPSTWIGWKERGKSSFLQEDYETALKAYTQALNPNLHCPQSEKHLILSNIVACRLKIGTQPQIEAAIETAKQLVDMSGGSWSKAHVRLASAYIATENKEYSNLACNSLQRALQIDPGNTVARNMLLRELRRDHRNNSSANNNVRTNSTSTTNPSPSAPPADLDDQDSYTPNNNNSSYSSSTSQPPRQQQQPSPQYTDHLHNNNNDIDDTITWQEKVQFYLQRIKFWYISQNDDMKSVLKVFSVLVILYVAFGGRFGLEYLFVNNNNNKGGRQQQYSTSNVYEEYYKDRYGQQQHHHHQYNDRYSDTYQYGNRRDTTYTDHNNRYDPYSNTSRRNRGSSSWSNMFGGYSNIFILGAIAYLAQRNGVNPFQALFFANMAMGRGGRRRHHHHRGWGGGGFGGPGMMMGGGGYRRQYPGGRPGGGMWGW